MTHNSQISGPDDRVCGALLPSLSGNVIIAKASFSRVVNGAIYLVRIKVLLSTLLKNMGSLIVVI